MEEYKLELKINLSTIMEEKGISINELQRRTNLDIKTIRNIKNGTNVNPNLKTLHILAKGLNVTIRELVSEESWRNYYDVILEKAKKDPLFDEHPIFDSTNIGLLDRMLSKIGLPADIVPHPLLKSVYISNRDELQLLSPLYFNISIRLNQALSIVEVVNFDIFVDRNIISERGIKEQLIKIIEVFS